MRSQSHSLRDILLEAGTRAASLCLDRSRRRSRAAFFDGKTRWSWSWSRGRRRWIMFVGAEPEPEPQGNFTPRVGAPTWPLLKAVNPAYVAVC